MNKQNENEVSLPALNVNLPALAPTDAPLAPAQKPDLIADEKLLGYFEVVLSNLSEDREEAGYGYKTFFEMVTNTGDATSSSKEAMINFLKLKTETNDRMLKVLDLWTKMKMRDRDREAPQATRVITVNQNNKIDNRISTSPEEMLKRLPNK